MQKVILSNGPEFELVPDGLRHTSEGVFFTFILGEKTLDQILKDWTGNDTITVKMEDISIQMFENYTKCTKVNIIPDYLIKTIPVCPTCGLDVGPGEVKCPHEECAAEFPDGPDYRDIHDNVCTVCVNMANINDRMKDAENAIDCIIASSLSL